MKLFQLTTISPFVRTFLRHIHAVGFPIAMAKAFDNCNIRLVIQGETAAWNTPGKAVLFVGDHHSGFEQNPLMAVLGGFQRNDVSYIAIPGIGAAHIFEMLDREYGSSYTLPVYPGLLAKDRMNIYHLKAWAAILH